MIIKELFVKLCGVSLPTIYHLQEDKDHAFFHWCVPTARVLDKEMKCNSSSLSFFIQKNGPMTIFLLNGNRYI